MTIAHFRRANARLAKNRINVLPLPGASADLIAEAETRLGVTFPPSYRQMLAEHGCFIAESVDISGIGRNGIPGNNAGSVVWATEADRKEGKIAHQMITIAFSGYGPFFVIDLGGYDEDGEAPVYEINTPGVDRGRDRIADSFGEFLENEVDLLIRSREEGDGVAFSKGEQSSRAAASYWKARAQDFEGE